jgi:hypothetical protein
MPSRRPLLQSALLALPLLVAALYAESSATPPERDDGH